MVDVRFDAEQRRLDLRIDFPKGSRFACPECGREGCEVHDTEEKTWRHLDFFQHQAYLTARVPRVSCPEHKVHQVEVPWARERSGFTLLFEALVMALVKEMPVAAVSALIGETDMRIWRVMHHYVGEAVEAQDLSGLERAGIDETSAKRGQDYVSVFADLDERRAVYVTARVAIRAPCRRFPASLRPTAARWRGSRRSARTCRRRIWPGRSSICRRPRSPSTATTSASTCPRRSTRSAGRRPSSTSSCLKNTRYLWLKRPKNLTARQQDLLDELLQQPLQTVRAYELSLRFDDFYELDDPDAAEEYLRRWIAEVHTSGLQPMIKFTRMLEDHWLGVMRWHHSRVSNGLLEGLNSLIQAAKRRARGYRTNRNYIAMIYLVAGKLNPGPAPV